LRFELLLNNFRNIEIYLTDFKNLVIVSYQNNNQKINADLLIDVERVIENKNSKLFKIIPKFIIRYLKRIVHQDDLNRVISENSDKKGLDFAEAILKDYEVTYTVRGMENLPDNGRFVFASNHPLGAMDGIALIRAVSEKFTNLKFPVNDILMNLKGLDNIFIPINKHGANSKDAARQLHEAYNSDAQILMFPAGLVSRKQKGQIRDLEWKNNFIKKAIESNRDIIPVHINGRNTNFFYNFANLRKRLKIKANLEMLYLVDEVYKQRGNNLVISFGKPVSWEEINNEKDKSKSAQKIKDLVYSEELKVKS